MIKIQINKKNKKKLKNKLENVSTKIITMF